MREEGFYFVTFKDNDVCFGLQVELHPNLSLWIRLPFIEIRMGIS